MTTTAPSPRKPSGRKAEIIRIFEAFGRPATIEEVTKAGIEADLWSQDEQDRLLFRAAAGEVRDVLNEYDANGVVVSLSRTVTMDRDGSGKVVKVNLKVQRAFWQASDAKNWLRTRVKQMREDYSKIERTVEHFALKWPDTDWQVFLPTIDWS